MSGKSGKIKRHGTEELEKMRSDTDWKRVGAMSEEELSPKAEADPDNPPLDEAFWQAARKMKVTGKKQVTLRLDADVLDWFREQGKGFQTRINAVLKTYKESRVGRERHSG
jgi:uncharacterized protein (DUF4415 family)